MIVFSFECLADDSHRRHFIECPLNRCLTPYRDCICCKCEKRNTWQPDYAAYYAAAKDDKPIEATITIWNQWEVDLALDKEPFQIWCDVPLSYANNVCASINHITGFDARYMRFRPDGDTTPWHELKEKWVQEYLKYPELPSHPDDKIYTRNDKPQIAFERSGSPMIEVWKKYGVPVFEVHNG